MSPQSRPSSNAARSPADRRIVTGYLLLASLTLLWGLNWPAMKFALIEVPPWTFRSGCLFVGGVTMLLLSRLAGQSLAIPRRVMVAVLLVAAINVTAWNMSTAYGLMQIEAGRAVIIAFTMPIWAAILATVVLGERPTWRHVAGLASGMAGLAVLIGPDFVKLEAAPVGALLILFASWCWAGGTIGLKMVDWRMPASVLSGWTILLGGVPIYLGMAVIEELPDLSAYSWTAYGGWAYSTFVAMVWCHFAWYTVVRIFPATVAAIGTLAIPVTGVFSSALLLGEPLGLREIAALTLVLAALGAVLLRSPVRTAAAPAPPPATPPAASPGHRGRDSG